MEVLKIASIQNINFQHEGKISDQSQITCLPIEIILKIIGKLQVTDIVNIRLTCRKLAHITRISLKTVLINDVRKMAGLSTSNNVYKEAHNSDKRFLSLSTMCIDGTTAFNLKTTFLSGEELQLMDKRNICDKSIIAMTRFNCLKSVKIDYELFDESLLAVIANEMPFIKELALIHANFVSLLLDYTGKFKELKYIELISCRLNRIGLHKLLSTMTELNSLKIQNCQEVRGGYWDEISLKNLTHFMLDYTNDPIPVDSGSIPEFLFRSPLLEKIEITTPNWNCKNIKSTSIVAYSNLQNLKHLKLESFHVKSDYLERMLTSSKKIEHLEIKKHFT